MSWFRNLNGWCICIRPDRIGDGFSVLHWGPYRPVVVPCRSYKKALKKAAKLIGRHVANVEFPDVVVVKP